MLCFCPALSLGPSSLPARATSRNRAAAPGPWRRAGDVGARRCGVGAAGAAAGLGRGGAAVQALQPCVSVPGSGSSRGGGLAGCLRALGNSVLGPPELWSLVLLSLCDVAAVPTAASPGPATPSTQSCSARRGGPSGGAWRVAARRMRSRRRMRSWIAWVSAAARQGAEDADGSKRLAPTDARARRPPLPFFAPVPLAPRHPTLRCCCHGRRRGVGAVLCGVWPAAPRAGL